MEGGPMRGLEMIVWPEGKWEASKKTASDGTDKQTNRHPDGHGDSMTESAQWGWFSENPAYGHSALLYVCDQGVRTVTIPSVWVSTIGVVNTMSPYLYHESVSISWVHVYTKSPYQYHKSISIPWVNEYIISPCQFHTSMYKPRVISNNMRWCLYHESRYSNFINK